MTIDPTTGLPAVLVTGTISSVVSLVVSQFAPLLLKVPGFRANDGSRDVLMRALVFLLTLGGLVGLAWSLGIPLPQAMWPNLLIFAAGGTAFVHVAYKSAKASGAGSVAVLPGKLVVPDLAPAGGYPSDGAAPAK